METKTNQVEQRMGVSSFASWKQEVRGAYSWYKNVNIPNKKDRIDREIQLLKKQIRELQDEKRTLKVKELDLSKEAYVMYVKKSVNSARESGYKFVGVVKR